MAAVMVRDLSITDLPCEIIYHILGNEELTFKDLINFACTCKQFHKDVFSCNQLWRTKLFQRWPRLKEVYIEYEINNRVKDWMKEIQARIDSAHTLMNLVTNMGDSYYNLSEVSHSEFQYLDKLFRPEKGAPHPLSYHFVIDELINTIECPVSQRNLTDKYYASKVIRYVKQSYLTDEWQKFIKLPVEKQLLEKGAVLVAQWGQPEKHVPYSYVCRMLDDIAKQAKEIIRERYPSHPIFSTSYELFEYWKNNIIDDNQWTPVESKQLIEALHEVMFDRLGFHVNSQLIFYSEDSFIDRVLEFKHGRPITIAIIFESICRRVGVKCEPIIFPAHFLLRWKEKYINTDGKMIENFYLDVFNGGQLVSKNSCPRLGPQSRCPIERHNRHAASTVTEVIENMAKNFQFGNNQGPFNGRTARSRSARELLLMINPLSSHDPYTTNIFHLARFYMSHKMDVEKLIDIATHVKNNAELTARGEIDRILSELQNYQSSKLFEIDRCIHEKMRTPEIKYAVGMIVENKMRDAFVVIIGWYLDYEATLNYRYSSFLGELGCDLNKPFYKVLNDGGSFDFFAQEHLEMATNPTEVKNCDIGRYFCEFKGTHYVPNKQLAKEYPEDAEVRNRLLAKYVLPSKDLVN